MKIMFPSSRFLLAPLLSLLLPHLASAQEAIPIEKAREGARLLAQTAGSIQDAGVTVNADLEKPFAIKVGGGVGFLVVPDQALTADKLDSVGTTMTPIAQLWTTAEASVSVNGRAAASSALRFYTLKTSDNEIPVRLYLVGVVKNEKGQAEVVVYGQGKEPLVRVPLEKSSSGSKDVPVELSGRKNDENSGTLTLLLPGKYQADIVLVKSE
jgi:hypothetical protein